MSKSATWPTTRTVNPVPPVGTTDWVIWAAWADRITFEEIEEVSGLSEAEVIRLMRRHLKRRSFERWRARATTQSLKHRRRFQAAVAEPMGESRVVLATWALQVRRVPLACVTLPCPRRHGVACRGASPLMLPIPHAPQVDPWALGEEGHIVLRDAKSLKSKMYYVSASVVGRMLAGKCYGEPAGGLDGGSP